MRTELLSPAGDIERAKFAIKYGADAVYVGATAYSLRARASNFDFSDLKELVAYAHQRQAKVYLVTNIICHNALLNGFIEFMKQIDKIAIDAFICADPYIISFLKEHYPQKEIHISTQQSISNSKAALFWKRNGATRVVLSRETTYEELKQLITNLDNRIAIEVFIHGAVCIAYSGRCMMSNNFSLRDANVGGCAQSCRWEYSIINRELKGKINEDFTMSAQDMSMLVHLDKLLDLNIASFKVEGRMKSIHYVATVINAYKKAMDQYYRHEQIDLDFLVGELSQAANRKTNDAWFNKSPNQTKMIYHDRQKVVNKNFAFIIKAKKDNMYQILTKNYFTIDDQINILSPAHDQLKISFKKIINSDGESLMIVRNPMITLWVEFNEDVDLAVDDIARIN